MSKISRMQKIRNDIKRGYSDKVIKRFHGTSQKIIDQIKLEIKNK